MLGFSQLLFAPNSTNVVQIFVINPRQSYYKCLGIKFNKSLFFLHKTVKLQSVNRGHSNACY